MTPGNLYQDLPADLPGERFDPLLARPGLRIQRIVSRGQCSPQGFWYDQDQHEWVLLVQGEARLAFEGDAEALHLLPGMYVDIPAHRRHRVEWTPADRDTIWLAVHYAGAEGP
jgi:cupin 2 domain-containing protein